MRTYRRLLRESYHPDMLRDALDRDRFLDLLWVEVEDDPDLAKVMQVEREELLRGDLPLFTARPASQDLWVNITERIPDFFTEPSLSIVRRRLRQFSHEDCERQKWFIQASLATMQTAEWPMATTSVPAAMKDSHQLRQAARAIGNRLEQLAFREQDEATWIGLSLEQDRYWSICPFGLDLESGLPGVALFLAYLGAITEEKPYTTLAQSALTMMQHHIQEWGDEIEVIGAFDGWGGLMYALTHLGVLWNRPDLISEAEAIVGRLPELID